MREPIKTNLKTAIRLFQVLSKIFEGRFICLSLSHHLIMVIKEDFFALFLKLFALGIFYMDLQFPLISDRCSDR